MMQPSAISASKSSLAASAGQGDADLERARHPHQGDPVGGDAERGELDLAGRGDPVGDAVVEARLDDADVELATVEARGLAAVSVAHASVTVACGDDRRLVFDEAAHFQAVARHARHAARAAEQLHAARRRGRAGSARRCRRCAGPCGCGGRRAPRLRASELRQQRRGVLAAVEQHGRAALALLQRGQARGSGQEWSDGPASSRSSTDSGSCTRTSTSSAPVQLAARPAPGAGRRLACRGRRVQ